MKLYDSIKQDSEKFGLEVGKTIKTKFGHMTNEEIKAQAAIALNGTVEVLCSLYGKQNASTIRTFVVVNMRKGYAA